MCSCQCEIASKGMGGCSTRKGETEGGRGREGKNFHSMVNGKEMSFKAVPALRILFCDLW